MTEPRPLKVFLCHASADKPAVRKLHRYLKQRGVQPWLDELDLLPGQDWQVEIPKAIFSSDVILVCLSKNSINKEGYVQKEITYALDKAMEKPEGTIFIIPAKLEECSVPTRLSRFHWVDLSRVDGHKRLMLSLNLRAEDLGPDVKRAKVTDESSPKLPKPDLAKTEQQNPIKKTLPQPESQSNGSVDIGGDSKGTTVITGDHNVIVHSSTGKVDVLPKEEIPVEQNIILSRSPFQKEEQKSQNRILEAAIEEEVIVGVSTELYVFIRRLESENIITISLPYMNEGL